MQSAPVYLATALKILFTALPLLFLTAGKAQVDAQRIEQLKISKLKEFLQTGAAVEDFPSEAQRQTYAPLIKLRSDSLKNLQYHYLMPHAWQGTWTDPHLDNPLEMTGSGLVFFQNELHQPLFIATYDSYLFCTLMTPSFEFKVLLFSTPKQAQGQTTAQCFVLRGSKYKLADALQIKKIEKTTFPTQLWGEYQQQLNGSTQVSARLQPQRIELPGQNWSVLDTGSSIKDRQRAYYLLLINPQTGMLAYLQIYQPVALSNYWNLLLYPLFKMEGYPQGGPIPGQRFAQCTTSIQTQPVHHPTNETK